jgi:predicted acylesterase/phospholipase RssA
MRLLLLIALCGLTAALGIKLIRFGGGGMYFWWQAGAAKYILERFDLLDVSMLGESAGSLVAALLACRVPFDDAAEVAIRCVFMPTSV